MNDLAGSVFEYARGWGHGRASGSADGDGELHKSIWRIANDLSENGYNISVSSNVKQELPTAIDAIVADMEGSMSG